MFDGVGHSGHLVLVAETSDIDIHSGTCLVRPRVVDDERLELVPEKDDAVGPVVQRRLLQAVRHDHDFAIAADWGVRRGLRFGTRG